MLYCSTLRTPFGPLTIQATEQGVRFVRFVSLPEYPNEHTMRAQKELEAYFRGARQNFSVQLDVEPGSAFQRRAQALLEQIPYGSRWTYSELAAAAGNIRATRAAGTACAKNPVPILLPCHRVVPSSGGIGNYAGGQGWKRGLLALEQGEL